MWEVSFERLSMDLVEQQVTKEILEAVEGFIVRSPGELHEVHRRRNRQRTSA